MVKKDVTDGIVSLIRKAENELPKDVIDALKKARKKEQGIAKIQLDTIIKNVELAKKYARPICQDTGIQTFFVSIGSDFENIKDLDKNIINGVKKATSKIPLRPNTVDPLTNINQKDNTGDFIPYILWEFTSGTNVSITALPKGAGSENMSKLGMLKPSVGLEGVKDFVVEEIIKEGGYPCPPTIVGVGIGGGADLALKLGKKSLLRPVGMRSENKILSEIELEIIDRINKSGIGPMGLGGKTTVLDVHIEKAHRHPASLPVGISVQCWANRRATMIIYPDWTWEVK